MTRLMKNYLIALVLSFFFNSSLSALSSLANNDPYPVYSAIYDPYLSRWQKEWMIGCNEICEDNETFSLSISVFSQKARSGRDFAHRKRLLGDLNGPWNMLGMLYGGIPAGETLQGTQLGEAKLHIFADLMQSLLPGTPQGPIPIALEDIIISATSVNTGAFLLSDSSQQIGFFSVPIKYRKIGVRAEMSFNTLCDFGFTIQGGVSEIRQTITGFIDLTQNIAPEVQGSTAAGVTNGAGTCPLTLLCPAQPFENNFFRNIPVVLQNNSLTFCNNCSPNLCASCSGSTPQPECMSSFTCSNPYTEIENELMEENLARLIFNQIGYVNCTNFEKTSFEDLRFIFWWRRIYEINRDRCSWPYFLLMPSIEANFVIPTAKKKDRRELFSLPFGNDGHWSVGFDAGISIDFVETVEIAFYGGVNYFVPRNIGNYHIPTDFYQQAIYPFSTEVKLSPGLNFNWRAVFNAYHFVDRVSAYVDYVMVKHEKDKIRLISFDPAFLIEQAECGTKFMSQFVDAAIYYDISPNIQLGILAQFPVAQRNAYRSTTYLGTFRCVF